MIALYALVAVLGVIDWRIDRDNARNQERGHHHEQ